MLNDTVPTTEQYLHFAKKMALEAGAIMVELEGTSFTPEPGIGYINEYVAHQIELRLAETIKATYPTHNLFDFKPSLNSDSDYEWICDYIDGAFGYSKGHRVSVTSIALQYKNKTIVSAIYNPWTKQLFSASKNEGAFLNDKKINVSDESITKGTLVDVEWWPWADYDIDTWLHNISKETGIYVLHVGSIIHAACLVASGSFGAAALGKSMVGKNHEIAAIKLIVEEAGGLMTDLEGAEVGYTNEIKGLLISNKNCHEDLVTRYKAYEELPTV